MAELSLSRLDSRGIDRRATDEFGIPGVLLMENAGRGCAELLMRLNPERMPTLVICGPGNNGGDGFVIARWLDNREWPVKVFLCADATQLTGDALINWRIANRCGLVYNALPKKNFESGLERVLTTDFSVEKFWIVDALFGTGLSRPVGAPHDAIIRRMNSLKQPIFAVDIPSGLDCDDGSPNGETVRATHTGTFVAMKKGFANEESSEWTGEVHIIDIGVPRVLIPPAV